MWSTTNEICQRILRFDNSQLFLTSSPNFNRSYLIITPQSGTLILQLLLSTKLILMVQDQNRANPISNKISESKNPYRQGIFNFSPGLKKQSFLLNQSSNCPPAQLIRIFRLFYAFLSVSVLNVPFQSAGIARFQFFVCNN